ncbi:hypothetical protein PPERSA_12457 [Pseudocohnilembus persalinus]|uniref:Heat shock protein 70 family n=1 Tax=Pseudocohnilembus persalinus TaxID=266149 RepID=A0A0V0QPJ5_PSEPJ|nr:hypothetical protein PPERSA_12457 [Pseudocohnilembus persalinus]|eukprot:KRX04010.1 hypothetical protein PPERSA_12457 [Pseudocohnilembus persalinus]
MQPQQQIGAVGIDFGSYRTVIGVAKKKGVDVICNQASARETNNIVSFGEKERFMGEQGSARAKSNWKNTCSFFNRIIGLRGDYPKLKEETKWITSKVITQEDGSLAFDITTKGEKKQLTPVQVTASMLTEFKKIIEHNEISSKEAVISYPSYWTEQEKKALLDAAQIADIKVPRLVSESSCVTLSYGLFRKSDLPEKESEARNVIFVDFGHSKLSTFVSGFTKEKCRVILQEHDRHLGSRDFDWTLLKFYDKIFQEENQGLSILENKKSILRALDAIQKQRTILSANSHATINAECLVEDCDLNYDLSKEEFESLISADIDRLRNHFMNLKQQIQEAKLNIHSVEIVGGASRTPIVQQLIQEVFEFPIQRTLNQTECIARGCAMIAAYMSPSFRVAEYKMEECNTYPIKISWQFLNNGNMIEEGRTATFFDKGCSIPNIKSLSFKRIDGIQMNLFYENEIEGFKSEILSVKIPSFLPKEDEYQLKVRIKLSLNGTVELTECVLIETYKVEEKIKKPKVEKKEGDKKNDKKVEEEEEDEYETKVTTKTRTTPIECQISDFHHVPAKLLEEQRNYEFEVTNSDRVIQETQAKKNELETFIYDWRDKSTGSYKIYFEEAVIPDLHKKLDEASHWLENDGHSASKSAYISKIDELKKNTDPVVKRYHEYTSLPAQINNLQQVIQTALGFVNNQDEKFAHITAEERKPIVAEVEKAQKVLADGQTALQNTPTHKDAPITCHQLRELENAIIKISQPIMSKPVPKVEEKKPQEGEQTQEKQQEKQEQKQEQPAGDKMEEEN